MKRIKKLLYIPAVILSLLSSCTISQEGVSLWSLKQFRDGRITLFDINNDNIQDLIVSGYQKGGKTDLKKVLVIENDLKTIESDNGKWEGRGYSFYLDKENKLWSRIGSKAERVNGNTFRSSVTASIKDNGELEVLYNDKKITVDNKKWEIPGLKIWIDNSNRLWILEAGEKTIAPMSRWRRKLIVMVNPLGEWIRGTGYKRGGRIDKEHIPVGDCIVAVDGKTQKIFWQFQANDTLDNYPSVYENKVFIGGQDKNFYALNLSTGRLMWRFSTASEINTTACVGKDLVYFGNMSGNFYALNTSTGGLAWSFKAKGAIDSSPALYENKIFFGSWDKNIYALDATNGRVLWKQQLPSYIGRSAPVIYDDKVIFGSWDKNVYALDINTGRTEWIFRTDDWIDRGSPAAAGGSVYIGNKKGNFYAINAATGSMRWQFDAGDAIAASPVITKNRVYVTSRDGYLYALKPSNGDLIWENRTRFKIFGSPAVSENKIYLSSLGGFLTAIVDTGMGKPYWPMSGGDPTHKSNINSAMSYAKKLSAHKTTIDKLLEENGLKKAE